MINNYCHFKSKIHSVNRNIPWFVPPTIKQIVLWIKVISRSLCHCVIYSQNSRNHLSKTAVKRGKVQKERNGTSKLNLVFYLTQSVVLFIFVCKSSTGWIVYKQSSIKIASSEHQQDINLEFVEYSAGQDCYVACCRWVIASAHFAIFISIKS